MLAPSSTTTETRQVQGGSLRRRPFQRRSAPMLLVPWHWRTATSGISPGARGFFIDLLLRIHQQPSIQDVTLTEEVWARITRCLPEEVPVFVAELEESGACTVEREPDGIRIICQWPPRSLTRMPGNWYRIREIVLRRDGWICRYCGAPADSVDHKTPRFRGGDHNLKNLVACCRGCNSRKRTKTLQEFAGSR